MIKNSFKFRKDICPNINCFSLGGGIMTFTLNQVLHFLQQTSIGFYLGHKFFFVFKNTF